MDVRIVCATHQDLDAMTAAGSFREDLYYRLAEIVIPIPTLAERSGDAVLLARHFANRFAREMQVTLHGLAPDAVEAIAAYRWPGNVRELENLVRRLAERHAAEDKQIVFLDRTVCFCSTMNRIDLPHLVWALESLADGRVVNRIEVDPRTEHDAKLALERMLALP